MTRGQLIGIGIGTLGLGLVIYFGFIKKSSDITTAADPGKSGGGTTTGSSKTLSIPKEHTSSHVTAPPVAPTPPAKATSKSIDSYKGTWIKSPADGVKMYNTAGSVLKTFKKGEDMGRVGDNLVNGYHNIYDGTVSGRVYDGWIKMALKI